MDMTLARYICACAIAFTAFLGLPASAAGQIPPPDSTVLSELYQGKA